MNGDSTIERFVSHLRYNGHPGLKIDRWPDRENRTSSDIDAIAGCFCIEHTSIDALPDQRLHDARFVRAIGGLNNELGRLVKFRLKLCIDHLAVTTGQDWGEIRRCLKEWILTVAPQLPDGQRSCVTIPGVPFPVSMRKASDRPPGVFVARSAPDDPGFAERVCKQLDGKIEKLVPYHRPENMTVLLIENDDFSLMSIEIMREVLSLAYPQGFPSSVDAAWYADTSLIDEVDFIDLSPALCRS